MATQDKLNAEEIEALLTENSKDTIEQFLTHYAKRSIANMRSAVYRLLYLELEKDDVSDVTYADYLKIFPNGGKNLLTQKNYRHSFFKFLYAFEHLKNPSGFEKSMIKDHEALKFQFCWYCIFELGMDVDEVKFNIKSDNFSDGILKVNGDSYKLPEKYHYMFELLKERGDYNGFVTLNDIFERLGNSAKLERKLLPVMAKLTRKGYMVTCGNCKKQYTNLSHNWRSVNNRIVCIGCAEALKKN
ncbi:hypothetical protein P2R12_23275 [Cytobacillus oceanisediminis]|uniref:hypothetical protein n=1 Tax=Cytobacillus oceanisediminis TaxID=665099 RepID=UPI0023DC2E3C|nr:hypothetical protein [Cytobacillus oceanisediminis]MDF2039867.1 hypothetical protein [Cytobacillus oceanisediminis]